MRDPKRIEIVLSLLRTIWTVEPDLRFNQLIYNLYREYSEENSQLGRVSSTDVNRVNHIAYDLYNLEDDVFITFLKRKAQEVEKNL